ncbi:hypothetical protein B7463_g5166, partial [Scytalidium lignicola]
MDLVTKTAAAVAGTAAAAMYLDVKNKRMSLFYLFEDAVARCQGEQCIWSRDGCYTWIEANDRVNQYAQWFLSKGVRTGDLVAFYLLNSPDFMFAWLGLWAIGAAPAMINYNLAGNALLHCVKVPQAKLLVVDDTPEFLSRIEGVRSTLEGELGIEIAVLDPSLKQHIYTLDPVKPDESYRIPVQGEWPMTIFYTSGTTGLPKGCSFQNSRGFLGGAARWAGTSLAVDGDRWYDCMPYYHGTGGIMAMNMMMSGVTLCIGKRFSTSKFWDDVRDSKATWITYVGETARYLLAAPPHPLDKEHNVRAMYGNGLRPDVWLKFRERFGVPEVVEFFNSTEGVFGLVTYARGDYFACTVGHHGAIIRHMTKGVYVPVLIDQATGAIERDPKTGFAIRQPYESGGEIIVSVPNEKVFAGYFRNPDATAKKFERDVFKKGDLWYRSGDALRRDSEGKWYFLDRLGDTFRWKGENVSTAEVSEVLGRYPGIVEANVYGVALPSHDGRAGCAAIYIDPSVRKNFDFTDFLRYARTHLPNYAVPVFLRLVKEMTPIHNNKQNKVPLRAEGVDPAKVKSDDQVYWVSEIGKGETYIEFKPGHWDDLTGGRARL